ncbi:hypothetical protein GJW-30_1_03194 [Variibacter gotjawalensis]|uniref:Uncharacterized protein n=1 Tax=Variibacter gotjawalensis TaxID=1333996 RepID=A0A0S3PXJ4_9BRAD|nr:hypothetical protein [Variibacter gotjawalensis]NIK46478.1 hypothetical protein [Variibacter gotjawalensis]RZS48387.1 hypothetical protein EV661_0798 [Variibacter gotjawalensis]BAT60646.1 hypothetical protein GJW-30_1_03194 [Variibacter gotjawalensis]
MPRPSFLPNARQTNVLLIAGFLSIGYAMYLRYLVIEPSTVGLGCDGGLKTWLCSTRSGVMVLFNNSVFGIAAVAFAALNLLRPSLLFFTLALVAASFGVVLYNVGLAGLGLGLLMLSFARPQRAAS